MELNNWNRDIVNDRMILIFACSVAAIVGGVISTVVWFFGCFIVLRIISAIAGDNKWMNLMWITIFTFWLIAIAGATASAVFCYRMLKSM